MTDPARYALRWGGVAACALVLLLALPVASTGPSGGTPPPFGPSPGGTSGRTPVAPAFVPVGGVRSLGAVPPNAPMQVLVGLQDRDPGGLSARVALETTPGTPLYGDYLTPAEVRAEYGPSPASVAAAVTYFAGEGLAVRVSPDGTFLEVQGSTSAVARAFQTSFERYELDGRLVFAHPTTASLPAGVPWSGVIGLGNTTVVRPSVTAADRVSVRTPAASGCPTSAPYEPCELLRAYNGSALSASGINGSGFRIAVVDVYDSAEPQTQLASDLAGFEHINGLRRQNASFIYPVPTSVNLNASASSGWGTEEALDLEWARGMAPGADVDMVLSPNATVALYYAVDWVVAHDAADVLSLSWGENDIGVYDPSAGCSDQCNATTDGSYTILHPVLEAAAAEGIGVFSATGDCGAAGGTDTDSTDYPASDPYAVAVGATDLGTNGSSGAYSGESGWSGNASGDCENQGGSGGGFSPYPRPAWQSAPGFPTNGTQRGTPDVSSAGGDGQINITMYGQQFGVGGTSAGTPVWADIELLADQYDGRRLGDLGPSLYSLARIGPYDTYFHDVTKGNNGYPAGPGWDPVTGLGSPVLSALVPALGAPSNPSDGLSDQLYGTPRIGRVPLTVEFAVDPIPSTAKVRFVDVGFGDGNASLVPVPSNGSGPFDVAHTYTVPGVYAATATVVDASGNSSTGAPIAVVAGGGRALPVTLQLSASTANIGTAVTFNVTTSNGTAPFTYDYFFGDGTYQIGSSDAGLSHAFGAAGSYCAAVVVQDGASPVDGGASARVGVGIGGAPVPTCPTAAALTASVDAPVAAVDLPGDLAFAVHTTGGVAPFSVQYTSDDPYVGACDCGIFSTPGNHTVRAYVNDSFDEEAEATTNVTLYPELTVAARASSLAGPAPLTVDFNATPSGGHFTGAASVNWSFGDGATLRGSTESPSHTYTTAGVYLASVLVEDQGGGRASAAWIINVTGPGYTGLVVGARISPAVGMPAGVPVAFNASAAGGTGPYRYLWSFGVNDSAFGANASQSYSALGCVGNGTCPLQLGLTVTDAVGAEWSRSFQLPGAVRGRASAVQFADSGAIASGVTPYHVALDASATGVLGLTVHWSFGDGGSANGTSVSHTYYAPGNYTLVETASDPYGDALVRTHAVVVTGVAIPPLVVGAGANRTDGVAPFDVAFNTSASGGSGAPYRVVWSFGDGTNDSGVVGVPLDHTYTAGGAYSAVANLSDGRGDLGSVTVPITVYDATRTSVALNATPSTITPGGSVDLSVHVTAVCLRYSVPGCSNGSALLSVRVGDANRSFVSAGPVGAPLALSEEGYANETVASFSNRSGMVWIWAVPIGPNYTGGAYAVVLVEGGPVGACVRACGPGTVLGLPAMWAFDGLLGAVTGGAAVVAYLVLRRRKVPPVGGPTAPLSP